MPRQGWRLEERLATPAAHLDPLGVLQVLLPLKALTTVPS